MRTEFKVGDFIEERFEIRQILQGGMGRVYVTFDLALDQLVAIKTLLTRYVSDERGLNMFLSEAQTWILLERHAHIVQAKSTFLVEQQPFVIVEYVDGGDLRRRLQGRALDLRLAIDLALQFCAGAEYAYRKLRLIHRDIKPENLLLAKSGTLKISDFGLARIREEFKDQDRGKAMGTPLYMAPEQWTDAESVTKQSDIYSFGVVLYEMLTGKRPFQGRRLEEIRKAHEAGGVPNPKTVNSEIPDELSIIVLKCLEKNPTRRFLYYEDLAEQLERVYELCTGEKYLHHIDEETSEMMDSQVELLNNGDSLFTIKRYMEALRYYDRLLELNPRSAKFWQRKGETLARLGKHHEAILYFGKALEIEPSNLDAAKGNIGCLMSMGRQRDALEFCSPILALNPNDRDLLRLKRELLATASGTSQGETLSHQQDQEATWKEFEDHPVSAQNNKLASDISSPFPEA
jgi:serine/threonine protein kinase